MVCVGGGSGGVARGGGGGGGGGVADGGKVVVVLQWPWRRLVHGQYKGCNVVNSVEVDKRQAWVEPARWVVWYCSSRI